MKSKRQIITALFLFIFFACGLIYFFEPFLSSWFEIVNPSIARNIFLPIDWTLIIVILLPLSFLPYNIATFLPDIFFGLMFFIYVVYYLKVIRQTQTEIYKKIAITPLIIFPLFFIIMSPVGHTFFERGINAYEIGGQSRLMLAGGSTVVRKEGLELLKSTTDTSIEQSALPSSLKKLGYWAVLEHENKLVIIGAGRLFNMADQFGFIIQEHSDPKPSPKYAENYDYFKLWELSDGIYLFEAS